MKMNIFLFGLLAGLTILSASVCAQVGNCDTCNCPPPQGEPDNVRIPLYTDMMQRMTQDGKNLVLVTNQGDAGAWVINLQALERKELKNNWVDSGETTVGILGESSVVMCPYDPDLLAFEETVWVRDSVNSVTLNELFEYQISTDSSWLITPVAGGSYRGAGFPYSDPGVNTIDESARIWLPGSKPGLDSFMIGYYVFGDTSKSFYGVYIPQTQQMFARSIPPEDTGLQGFQLMKYTKDKKDSLWSFNGAWFMDTSPVVFPRALYNAGVPIQHITYSPDSSLVAFDVQPDGIQNWWADTVFDQVWVYRIGNPHFLDTINFQSLFCTYSLGGGIWPEFITDSTLAVSMHHDGDESSPLWEITIGGQIVRQLTFLPEFSSQVQETPLTDILRVFPNPTTNELYIPPGTMGTARLFDLLGRKLLEENDDGSGATLDVSHLEAGAYFLRLGPQSTKVVVSH